MGGSADGGVVMITGVIFKRVGDGRPYPDHGLTRAPGPSCPRARSGSTSW